MTSTRHDAPFEVLRFSAAPLNADVAVLELEGRFTNGVSANGGARLLVEHDGGERLELPAVHGDAQDDRWRATFAVPAGHVGDSAYALALPGVLLELPAPDAEPEGDRHVALARELNALRARLDEALAAADAHEAAARRARADAEAAAAEHARAAAEQARRTQATAYEQVQAAEQRARAIEADLVAVREELAEERRGAEASAHTLSDALDATRAEARDLRRALKQSRAELEGLRRELAPARAVPPPDPPVVIAPEAEDAEDLGDPEDAELPTTAQPPYGDERTIPLEDLPDGEPVERVRVVGRDRPRASAAPPPPTAEIEPVPPIVGYLLAALIFVIAIVVITMIVF